MVRLAITTWAIVLCSAISSTAQTISLPTFHSFSYSGTVEVPDGGTMSLGGNAYSASSRSQRSGLFPGPVARSGIQGVSNASITATIINNHEIDRQLLGGTPQEFVERHRKIEAMRDGRQNPIRSADRTHEGKVLVRYARSLYQQGRHSAARDTYLMAADLLEPKLRELAIAEMRRHGLQ
jgi:hypothetical protein